MVASFSFLASVVDVSASTLCPEADEFMVECMGRAGALLIGTCGFDAMGVEVLWVL
jgi:hypothetical protein